MAPPLSLELEKPVAKDDYVPSLELGLAAYLDEGGLLLAFVLYVPVLAVVGKLGLGLGADEVVVGAVVVVEDVPVAVKSFPL